MLRRTPPVCGYGYHGGMAFATKLAHWKPKVNQLFKRGGHVCFFASSCMIQSFLRPIQGLGAKVKVIHANQHQWRGCQGMCQDCWEHLSNVQSFVNLWSCGASDFLSPKNIVFSGMAALFCILVHSWGIGACHQQKCRKRWWTCGSCHRSLEYLKFLEIFSSGQFWLGDLQQWWVVNCCSLWSFCCFGVSELQAAIFSLGQSHSPF